MEIKQPSKDWAWMLDDCGSVTRDGLVWEDVAAAMRSLEMDRDSFMSLQPQQDDQWFLQCAVALDDSHRGEYLVECGWSDPECGYLARRFCGLDDALALFRGVWENKTLDTSGFEDHSDILPSFRRKRLMRITRLEVGEIGTNCYILEEKEAKLCAVIDPGGDADRIIAQIRTLGLSLRYILLTHGHYDHVDALPELAAAFPEAEIWMHRKDADSALPAMLFPLARMLEDPDCPVKEIHYLKAFNDRDVSWPDTEELHLGGLDIHPMHTPGHSEGSVSFRISGGPIFCGDTLFRGSCGRTDFPGGSVPKMMASLRFFAQMYGDAEIYPGHMGETTLEQERKYNPYIRQALRNAP